MLRLNEFRGTIIIGNTTHSLNGTFLVQFHNETININNQEYISMEKPTLQAIPSYLRPTPREKEYKEMLSLEMMKQLHINNTEQIALFKDEKIIHLAGYSCVTTVLVIIVFVSTMLNIRKQKKNNKTEVIITEPKTTVVNVMEECRPPATEQQLEEGGSKESVLLQMIEDNHSKMGRVNIQLYRL